MNLADDIAYGVHDFEDALALNLFSKEAFEERFNNDKFSNFISSINERYKNKNGDKDLSFPCFVICLFGKERKRYIGRLVHYFLTNVEISEEDFEEPLFKYRVKFKSDAQILLEALKDFVRDEVIFSPNVQQLEFKGQMMIIEVFEILNSDPRKLLPIDCRNRLENEKQERVICDYIAGMTDAYLLKTFERLTSPRMGSVFDKL